MFNPTTSKFFNELMVGACNLLGLDPATATEAEIDTAMQKAGTLEAIKAAAKDEAVLEVKSQMDDFTSRLAALETSVKEKDETIKGLNADLTAKTTELETAQNDVAEKAKAVTGLEAKNKELAGKVSSLQAAGIQENDDNSGPIYSLGTGHEIQPIKTETLDKRLGLN